MKSIMTNQQILLFTIVENESLRRSRVVDRLNAVLPTPVVKDVEVEGGFTEFLPGDVESN